MPFRKPSGGGVSTGVDQTARDAAEAAQTDIDDHEAVHPGSTVAVDQTARDAATAAQTELDEHEAATHNTDQPARDAALAVQVEVDAHEASTHNRDATARQNADTALAGVQTNQDALIVHRDSTHNTDQIARDGVDTAQQAANAAGMVAMDANAAAVTAGEAATAAEADAATADQRILGHLADHPLGFIAFEGHGRPNFDPGYVGQFAVNQSGATWVAGFELIDHSVGPSWIAASLADVAWNRFEGVSVSSGDPQTIGGFYYRTHTARFHVLDQQFNTENLTWSELIDLYRANNNLAGNPPAGLVPLAGEKSIFLTGPHIAFADDDEAAAYVAAEQIAAPATKVFVWFVGERGDESNWEFRWATVGGWVAGVTDITEALHWNGPFEVDTGGSGVGSGSTTTTVVGGFSRSLLRAKNAAATRMARIVRRVTLSTSLALIDNNDDIEILLETGGVTTGSLDLAFVYPPIRISAGLIKSRVASTLTADLELTNSNNDFVQADKSKYIAVKIDRGNHNDAFDFAHETLFIGRIDNTTLCMWTAASIPQPGGAWAFITVNRLQYGTQSSGQQLGSGSAGGYYFGAFYQQAAAEPVFNGVPDNSGSWTNLGDWQANRDSAVDATSVSPIWIAYASGYINASDVVFVNTPQVFAEFSTQYSNDGFSTITNVAPVDPDGWWRRDRLPGGGVTAPIPLFHTDNPWIPVWAEEDFYTKNSNGESKDINLNLSNVTAIRWTLTAFGRWGDDGSPERRGAICTDVMPRPPEGWSTADLNDNTRNSAGLYSVSYHESAGLQVHHQDDGSAVDFNIPIGSYRDTDYPAQAWACAMKFVADDSNQPLAVTDLRIFDSHQHYERFLWTIEVQRET